MGYSKYNAKAVLAEVDALIADYEERKERATHHGHQMYRVSGYNIRSVYERLSIFDWWVNTLGIAHLKQMRSFLREAIKLGFNGYVCFKVGARGCANGMWAHTVESKDGYSPDEGEVLYRSFTPAYTYWSFTRNGEWMPDREKYDSLKTIGQLEKAFFGFGKEKSA